MFGRFSLKAEERGKCKIGERMENENWASRNEQTIKITDKTIAAAQSAALGIFMDFHLGRKLIYDTNRQHPCAAFQS